MGESFDNLASTEKLNVFGEIPGVTLMQSENGVVGGIHGSLSGGSLTSTFTSSQGLMLMLPSMMRITEELFPSVFHVSSRAVGGRAHSIFGDHHDVMSAVPTGFCLLSSASVQECHDLALVAHLSSLSSSLPFIHQFDGFRTSHEINTIDMLDYDEISELMDESDVEAFRQARMNSTSPTVRGMVHCPDTYFQLKETMNTVYFDVPEIVQSKMDLVAGMTNRPHSLFEYYGPEDAENVVVVMASGGNTIKSVLSNFPDTGVVVVKLFLPWSTKHFLKSLPLKTLKRITVLDRVKEHGKREPLYLNVVSSIFELGPEFDIDVVGGRYGLGSKEFSPQMVQGVFENMLTGEMKDDFTVGIEDDLTQLNISYPKEALPEDDPSESTYQCVFYGIGGDGTIGSNQEAIKIVQEHTDLSAQGYFVFDLKKSGGLTVSHLRFGNERIEKPYLIQSANFVGCHVQSYLSKYDVVESLKEGGTLVLNTEWKTLEELEENLPNSVKKAIAEKNVVLYNIDANTIATEIGMGRMTNMIMQSVFFHLNESIIDPEVSIKELEDSVQKFLKKGGEEIVNKNLKCIQSAKENLVKIEYPEEEWKNLEVDETPKELPDIPSMVKPTPEVEEKNKVIHSMLNLKGDDLPVSNFDSVALPSGGSEQDLRNIAIHIPGWDSEKCIECLQCALICPQSTIRPFLVSSEEIETYNKMRESDPSLPEFHSKEFRSSKGSPYEFAIQVNPHYCVECYNCENSCPTGAISMEHITEEEMKPVAQRFDYSNSIPGVTKRIDGLVSREKNPLMNTLMGCSYCNFGYGCQGCGEVGYMRLMTQIIGERMITAMASGCVPVWLGGLSNAMSVDEDGYGPSTSATLFENNAEFGIGLTIASESSRKRLQAKVVNYLLLKGEESKWMTTDLRNALVRWLEVFADYDESLKMEKEVRKLLDGNDNNSKELEYLRNNVDLFKRTSVWAVGGDGWSSDINFGGLIHSLALGENMKVLVLDSEVYSNTGGQASKGTQLGAVAKFLSMGKETGKMELADIAMNLGNVYVASCCLSNPQQYIKAIREAEEYEGPALVICYSPCISHGADMTNTMKQYEMAVKSGYWNIFRYDPRLEKEGRNPFQLDFKKAKPAKFLDQFLDSNARFSSLERINEERFNVFREELKDSIASRYEKLLERSDKSYDREPKKELPGVKTRVEEKIVKNISKLKKETEEGTRSFEESTSIHTSLFHPHSIVVVGGSSTLHKPGGRLLKNLKDTYSGDLFVINEKQESVQDIKVTQMDDLEEGVDLAIISTPAHTVKSIVEKLLAKGVRSFICVSAGFKELGGEGAELERELTELLNSHDASLMGPNCIGLLNESFNGTFVDIKGNYDPEGKVDVISSSGATACFLIEKGSYHGLSFRNVMSVGNAAQLGVEDFIRYLDENHDEKSAKIKLVYLEDIQKPKIFFKHCKSLKEKGCRIVAVKAGVSEAGSRAASSHTGAMATPDHIINAGFRKAGVMRVNSRDEMVKIAGILVEENKMKGRNLAVVTHAGGSGILLTDCLAKNGVDVPVLEDELRSLLNVLPHGASVTNPVDFLATGTMEHAESIIDEIVKNCASIDGIAFIFGSPGLVDITPIYEMINRKKKEIPLPIYSVFPSILTSHESIETFKKEGNFFFDDEVNFGNSLAKMINYEHPPGGEGDMEDHDVMNLPRSAIKELRNIMGENKRTGYLHPVDVKRMLNLVGIPTVEEIFCSSVEEVRNAVSKIGFPFAMKVVGPIHKTNVDGVVTDITSEGQGVKVYSEFQSKIDGFEGVIVQPMVKGWEFFCGAKYDDYLDGHMLAFGSGGVQLELLEDVRILLSPTNGKEIERNLRKLKTYDLFEGFRNKVVDKEKFIDIILKLDQLLMIAPEILEMDINPIISTFEEGGFLSVDCRIKVAGSEDVDLALSNGNIMLNKQVHDGEKTKPGHFPTIERAPLDPILGMNIMFLADRHPQKVNLGIGAYKTEDLQSYTLKCVEKAEIRMLENKESHDYAPEDGVAGFNIVARELVFGKDCPKVMEKKITTLQSISGSGALSVGADFIMNFIPNDMHVCSGEPTWANHYPLLQNAGFNIKTLPYLDRQTMKLDFENFVDSLERLDTGSVVLFHASCHNPTGVDPTHEQWDEILHIVNERNMIPFFDAAYLGFATGDPAEDAYSIRRYVNEYPEGNCLVAQSFSKNFGLYGERTGALHVVCNSETNAENIRTQIKKLVRRRYSMPPIHGAKIVETVLTDEALTAEWREELQMMRDRLKHVRDALYEELVKIGTPGDWSHIDEQTGMFSYTGLSAEQCKKLVDDHHIYLVGDGRISLTGLNDGNVPYVAECIKTVVEEENIVKKVPSSGDML